MGNTKAKEMARERRAMWSLPSLGDENYYGTGLVDLIKLRLKGESIAREKRAKWIIPGFDPKKHKIISQGENKMEENEGVEGMITAANGGGPMYFSAGGIAVVGQAGHSTVKIDKVSNGFIVEIGCKKFVAEDWDKLAKKLGDYWKDPVAAEKKYAK